MTLSNVLIENVSIPKGAIILVWKSRHQSQRSLILVERLFVCGRVDELWAQLTYCPCVWVNVLVGQKVTSNPRVKAKGCWGRLAPASPPVAVIYTVSHDHLRECYDLMLWPYFYGPHEVTYGQLAVTSVARCALNYVAPHRCRVRSPSLIGQVFWDNIHPPTFATIRRKDFYLYGNWNG